jgi:hypothetical protein
VQLNEGDLANLRRKNDLIFIAVLRKKKISGRII